MMEKLSPGQKTKYMTSLIIKMLEKMATNTKGKITNVDELDELLKDIFGVKNIARAFISKNYKKILEKTKAFDYKVLIVILSQDEYVNMMKNLVFGKRIMNESKFTKEEKKTFTKRYSNIVRHIQKKNGIRIVNETDVLQSMKSFIEHEVGRYDDYDYGDGDVWTNEDGDIYNDDDRNYYTRSQDMNPIAKMLNAERGNVQSKRKSSYDDDDDDFMDDDDEDYADYDDDERPRKKESGSIKNDIAYALSMITDKLNNIEARQSKMEKRTPVNEAVGYPRQQPVQRGGYMDNPGYAGYGQPPVPQYVPPVNPVQYNNIPAPIVPPPSAPASFQSSDLNNLIRGISSEINSMRKETGGAINSLCEDNKAIHNELDDTNRSVRELAHAFGDFITSVNEEEDDDEDVDLPGISRESTSSQQRYYPVKLSEDPNAVTDMNIINQALNTAAGNERQNE